MGRVGKMAVEKKRLWLVGVKPRFFLQHGKWSYLLTATEKNGCFHKAGSLSQMTPLNARDSKKYLKKNP